MILTISGKMLSGKDTLADLIVPTYDAGAHRFTFSDLIREEAAPALDVIRTERAASRALVDGVAAALDVDPERARQVIDAVAGDALDDHLFTFSSRTEGTRFVLQHLGSDWRPENYWANKVFKHAKDKERDHGVVVMVGSRYPAEHRLFTHDGAYTIRLDVSRSVQKVRAMRRDGVIPTDAQFDHPGETLLDGALFGLRVDTDHASPMDVLDLTLDWLKGRPANG